MPPPRVEVPDSRSALTEVMQILRSGIRLSNDPLTGPRTIPPADVDRSESAVASIRLWFVVRRCVC